MKRNALILGVVFSLLATACGAQATPTVNPVDIQDTAEAAAFTMVAQTQESLPSPSGVRVGSGVFVATIVGMEVLVGGNGVALGRDS